MSESYPLSTGELLVIASKEIAKTIPIAGSLIAAHEAVFASIEMNRVKIALAEVFRRLEEIEKQAKKPQVINALSMEVLLYGCDQVRHDPLAVSKAKEYGSAISHFMLQASPEVGELVEILDNLRKLNTSDLKILYEFRLGDEILRSRRVDELVGYKPQIAPFGNRGALRERITTALPSFKRLEGLGVLYMADNHAGGVVHEIGPLSRYLSQAAFLSNSGVRLVTVLPA
jgi:hypothetical protein